MEREELIEALLDTMEFKRNHRREREARKNSIWSVLYYVGHRQEEGVHPGELCDELGVTTARITAILKELENQGLLTRMQEAGDKRKVCVRLTEEGIRKVEEHSREHRKEMEQLIDDVGAEAAETYLKAAIVLNRIREEKKGKTDGRRS